MMKSGVKNCSRYKKRKCSSFKNPQEKTCFSKNKNSRDGLLSHCKLCEKTDKEKYRGKSKKLSGPEKLHLNTRVNGECIEWKGGLCGKKKYGIITVGGEKIRAHRFSYELSVGPIREGMVIMHTCDNTKCVNPKHLKMGTQLENMRDCTAKGRQRWQK